MAENRTTAVCPECNQDIKITKDNKYWKHYKSPCSASGSQKSERTVQKSQSSDKKYNIAKKLTYEETYLDQVLNGTKPIPTSLPLELSQLISTRHSTKSTMSQTDASDGVSPITVPPNTATVPSVSSGVSPVTVTVTTIPSASDGVPPVTDAATVPSAVSPITVPAKLNTATVPDGVSPVKVTDAASASNGVSPAATVPDASDGVPPITVTDAATIPSASDGVSPATDAATVPSASNGVSPVTDAATVPSASNGVSPATDAATVPSANNGVSPATDAATVLSASDGVSPVTDVTVSSSSNRVSPTKKNRYNYLLLDPLKLDKIDHDDQEFQLFSFKHFVESIFYVGRGTNDRPFKHLRKAKTASLRVECEGNAEGEDAEGEAGEKIEKILDIWREERGVVILHLFHCCTLEEAHNKETCLIDTKGVKNLTNKNEGKYRGEVKKKWEDNKDRLGVHLLYKAFKIYLASPPQEIYKGEH